jgi:hypothetical protein
MRSEDAQMFGTLVLGWLSMAAVLPTADVGANEPIAVSLQSDNGSVPPPYRRSTSIVIDATGHGVYESLSGYDREAPGQRYRAEFTLDAEARAAFAAEVERLGVFGRNWRERDKVPVGGPLRSASLSRGEQRVRIPPFPVDDDAEAAREVLAAIRALVPEEVLEGRHRFDAGREPE